MERLDEEVENNANISATRRKLDAELEHSREDLEDVRQQMDQVEQEKAQKEKECVSLEAELEKVNDSLNRAHKEKKTLEERLGVSQSFLSSPIALLSVPSKLCHCLVASTL